MTGVSTDLMRSRRLQRQQTVRKMRTSARPSTQRGRQLFEAQLIKLVVGIADRARTQNDVAGVDGSSPLEDFRSSPAISRFGWLR
jgi:hypothetical protein